MICWQTRGPTLAQHISAQCSPSPSLRVLDLGSDPQIACCAYPAVHSTVCAAVHSAVVLYTFCHVCACNRVMAELVISLLQRGVADILHSPLTQAEKEYCAAHLPPPMVLGNYQALSSKCFVGDMFR